ncbi:MAG: Gmad2 immunoglobulin-like domain-containing protein [Actinomycetota bacterium]|nr:Gmad2 immunoglobulin-like domain-containing protein [Actinomycetota bacterium]
MAALVAATSASGCGDDGGGETARPAPTTTTAAPLEDTFPGVWPYTTAAEADGYTRGVVDETYLDPVRTAREFMRVYIGMEAPVAGEYRAGDAQSGEVEVRPRAGGRLVTTVSVRRVSGEGSPWVVVSAAADMVKLITPVALEGIRSPVNVSGEASAYEGNVVVQVKEDGMGPGQFLGQEPLTGGSGPDLEPYAGPVAFKAPTKAAGAVVVLTYSAEDDSVEQASVVRVRFERTST